VLVDVLVLVHVVFWQPSLEVADNRNVFDHEKLDVYRCALELYAKLAPAFTEIPRGHGAIVDQFRRAILSIPLSDRQRFFAIARGSAMECAAILDVCEILEILETDKISCAKQLLLRIVQMLSRLCR